MFQNYLLRFSRKKNHSIGLSTIKIPLKSSRKIFAGQFVRKLGEPSQTPYPIGIDVTSSGLVLVADTHGNHLHVVVFNTADGTLQQSFTHNEFRVGNLERCNLKKKVSCSLMKCYCR